MVAGGLARYLARTSAWARTPGARSGAPGQSRHRSRPARAGASEAHDGRTHRAQHGDPGRPRHPSTGARAGIAGRGLRDSVYSYKPRFAPATALAPALSVCADGGQRSALYPDALPRSEEHTSELQSRPHLVCRLLLEKKKESTHNPNRKLDIHVYTPQSPTHVRSK